MQPGTDTTTILSGLAAATEIVKNISIVGLLIFILWGGKQRWWVFGWVYEAEAKRSEEYKQIVFHTMGMAGTAVEGLKESARSQVPWGTTRP